MEANRATLEDAEAAARSRHWVAMEVAYPGELAKKEQTGGATQKAKRTGLGFARGLLSLTGHGSALGDGALNVAAKAVDRQSLVSGKRVSVRVDLGGRRRIKKNKKIQNR